MTNTNNDTAQSVTLSTQEYSEFIKTLNRDELAERIDRLVNLDLESTPAYDALTIRLYIVEQYTTETLEAYDLFVSGSYWNDRGEDHTAAFDDAYMGAFFDFEGFLNEQAVEFLDSLCDNETVSRYLDYDKLARDLQHDYYSHDSDSGVYVYRRC